MKYVLTKFGIQSSSSQPFQHILNMGDMFLKHIQINHNVVEIDHTVYIQEITEGFVDIRLKDCRGIG